MQIQRLQTLWLLLALGCMVAFICLPFGTLDVAGTGVYPLYPYDFIGLIIPAGLAALFQLIGIFMFKNLPTQRTLVALTIMMALVAIGITIYILCDSATMGVICWGWQGAFAVASLGLTIMALSGINHDIKLLNSYNRLR